MKGRHILTIIVVVVLLGAVGYWYATRTGWFDNTGPTNLPTAAERERMDAIDHSSSQIAPNAVPGAGVRPRGSLPPQQETQQPRATTSVDTDATNTPTPQ